MNDSLADRSPHPAKPKGPAKGARNYRWKIFYVNPDDGAFFVPMRYGSGMDFNYARWPGKLTVTLVAVGVLWALFTLLS